MSWPTISIKDVARIVGGATPKSEVSEYWGGSIKWTTPKDLSNLGGKFIADTPRKITELGLKNCSAEMLPANSVLFSSRAPIGHVAINTVPMATNQGFKSFVPSARLDASFLYWWLDANRVKLQEMGTGATFKEVSKAAVERIEIPLPPLEEQKRIAAILDQAGALRRLRARALDRLNALGQAIFHEMFGDLIANTKQFQVVTVGDVVAGFETGKNLAEDPDGGKPDAVRVLKISAVTSGTFKPDESKPLPSDYIPPQQHYVRNGDILFSRANTTELIGATAMVLNAPANLVLPDKLWRFVWRKNSPVEPHFMLSLFSSPAFRDEIGKRATGTSGSMKNISQGKVLTIGFGCPPLSMQEEFARRIKAVGDSLVPVGAGAERSEALFASLQHRAFRGEL